MNKFIGIFLIIACFLNFGCKPDPDAETGTPKVTVTFIVDGGTPNISPITINKGTSLGNKFPPYPTRNNLEFAGWYEITDTSFKQMYTSSTVINKNTTLKARWIQPSLSSFTGSSATVTENLTYQGKTDVTQIEPKDSSAGYDWSVLTHKLDAYAGQDITITLSMDVWVSDSAKIAWQIATNNTYPLLLGSTLSPIEANKWITLTSPGIFSFTPAAGDVIYLSGGGSDGQLKNNPVTIYIANFNMTITPVAQYPLTVYSKKDLKPLLNTIMNGKTITWSSADSTKVSVDANGIATSNITEFTTAELGNGQYRNGPAKSPIKITAKATDDATQDFIVIATTAGQEDIMSISPFKDYFPSSILVGNIASSGDGNGSQITVARLTRHFNTITPENDMKPQYISPAENTYNYTNADRLVNSIIGSNMKVVGHTLLWHSQIPQWQKDMAGKNRDVALAAMKKNITDVVTHFKGKIYIWDVLNEIFPDSGFNASSDWKAVMRKENPWYNIIGSDFVYEGYLAARLADPQAKLYYNDYNTDQVAKATMIRDMVKAVNDTYLALPSAQKPAGEAAGRLLIEGIGMQEHHNLSVTAASLRATLNLFKPLGVKVSVSEIDVLGNESYNAFSSSTGEGANKNNQSTVTNNQLLRQATRYGEYMAVYMEFKDIIERISIWGVTDNNSWRSGGIPLLFDANGKAKPAYYKFAGAVTK